MSEDIEKILAIELAKRMSSPFYIDNGSIPILRDMHGTGCRPATDAEIFLWNKLVLLLNKE